jgi:uncharacterized membrane protein YccC
MFVSVLRWLRDLAATVGTFDRSALEPGYTLRCTAGVAIPLAIATLAGQPLAGVPAAIGAFITGFTSMQGIYRTRLATVLLAALGMSVTSFLGAVSAHSTPAVVAATAVAAYTFATIGQIGPAASTVALNSFVAFVLFSSQPLMPPAAIAQSGLVLAGGLIQALLLLLAWPAARHGVERRALADVYRNLAEYAEAIARGTSSFPPVTPLATARQVLADPQPFARAAEMARMNRLLEDSEIIRRRLGALAAGAVNGKDPSESRAAGDAAAYLFETANVLNGNPEAHELPPLSSDDAAFPGTAELNALLRDALEAATMIATGRVPKFQLASRPRPGPYVQYRIDFFARESVRFALVLSVAMILGRHFAAERGYWIPLTAAIVLKPDFQTTIFRGVARIAGTLLGAIVATGVAVLSRAYPALQAPGILLAAAAAYLTFNPNYALFTVAITSFVVLVLGMRGLPATTAIDARLLDTLAGGALAMIGYLILPTWEYERTRALLAELLDAQRRLAVLLLRAYATPANVSREAIESRRTELWKIRTAVEASIDRMRGEPRRPHSIGAGRALRILAATQRFALATFALESALETTPPAPDCLASLADALDADMGELAAALRESRRAEIGRVSDAIDELSRQSAGTSNPRLHAALQQMRAYGDAVSRLARLLGKRP